MRAGASSGQPGAVAMSGWLIRLGTLLCAMRPMQCIGMKTSKVVALTPALNDANFLRRLRQVAEDSSRVVVLRHAKERMVERKISLSQVISCLKKGAISEPAHLAHKTGWKATVTHRCGGDTVSVVAVLETNENGECCIVITVMR